jgi:TATA-box binding protein (TBP) (component of TFIID and TFIIIB)
MLLEDKKILNVKISKQGKFQMTGCKNVNNAIEFIKHLYGLLIETEEWTGETLFTYKTENIDLEDSNADVSNIDRNTNNGLTAIFKVAMMNLDFSTGYKIRRDLLSNFINKYTEFTSIFESSIATSVNIKIKSNNKFDSKLNRLQITAEGECIEDTINFEEFYNTLSAKEQKDESKKDAFHTFLVFASGSIIMSSSGMEMPLIFNKLVKLLIENRDKIEEKPDTNISIESEWLD